MKDVAGVVGESSEVRARGKAWAMEFKDGELVFSIERSASCGVVRLTRLGIVNIGTIR